MLHPISENISILLKNVLNLELQGPTSHHTLKSHIKAERWGQGSSTWREEGLIWMIDDTWFLKDWPSQHLAELHYMTDDKWPHMAKEVRLGMTNITGWTNTSIHHHQSVVGWERNWISTGEKAENSLAALWKGKVVARKEDEPRANEEKYFPSRQDFEIDQRQRGWHRSDNWKYAKTLKGSDDQAT